MLRISQGSSSGPLLIQQQQPLAASLSVWQEPAKPLSPLADMYDENVRGARALPGAAGDEAAKAFDDPIGLKTYTDAVGNIAGLMAGAAVPSLAATTEAPMLIRMAMSGGASAAGMAATEGVKNAISSDKEDPLQIAANIGGAAIIGAAMPPGFAALGKSASKLYRALPATIQETLARLPRSAQQVFDDIPQVQAAKDANMALTRGSAARDAFRAIVPEGQGQSDVGDIVWKRAISDARRAAAKLGKGPVEIQDDPTVAQAISDGVMNRLKLLPGGTAINATLQGVSKLRNLAVTNAADWMRNTWGDLGNTIAGQFTKTENLKDQLMGERWGWFKRELLDGFTRAERINWSEAAASREAPMNDKVAQAVQKFHLMRQQAFTDASGLGIREMVPPTHAVGQQELFSDVAKRAELLADPERDWIAVPLQYRQNYVPKFRDPAEIAQLGRAGSPLWRKGIDLLTQKYGMTAGEAEVQLAKMANGGPGGSWEFNHSFQFARDNFYDELGLSYEKDPMKWGPHWLDNLSGRLSRAQMWGPQDEEYTRLKGMLQEKGGDTNRLEGYWRAFIGHPQHDDFAEMARAVGAGLTISGLGPRVGVLQLMQLANPIAKFGYRRTMAGVAAALNDPEMRKFVEGTGALLPSSNMSWMGSDAGNMSTWWVQHMTGMPTTDRYVRVVSSIAAGLQAQEDAAILAQGGANFLPKARAAAERLTSLGLNPAEIGPEGLNMAQMKTAMLNGSNITQFSSHMSTMPMWWKTPQGRWIYKFRTFAKQQSTFIQNEVIGEARRGNFAPLARYVSAYAGLHEAASPILDFVSGVDRKEDMDAYEAAMDKLTSLTYAGMLGGFGDAINVARQSTAARVAGYLAGPAVGNLLQTGEAVANTVRTGDPAYVEQRAVRMVPLVGGWLERLLKESQ